MSFLKAQDRLTVLAVVTVAFVAACTTGNAPPPAIGSTPIASVAQGAPEMLGATAAPVTAPAKGAGTGLAGWLAHASNGVVFLQWTRSGDALNGSLTQAYTASGEPTNLKHENASFTGVVSGDSFTLSFPEGLGLSRTWTGAFSGDTLTLSYPAADGSLSTQTFYPASVADYNAALALEQSQVQQAQAAAAAASTAAAAAAAEQQAQAAVDRLKNAVLADIHALGNDPSAFQSDLDATAKDIAAQQGDVKTTYTDMQAVWAEAQQYPTGNYGQVCSDAATVASDEATVASDEATVESDGATLESDIYTLHVDENQVHSDFKQLVTAEAATPGYGVGLPSEGVVTRATSVADDAVTAARQGFAGLLLESKQLVSQAQGYVATAQMACKQTGG